MTSRSLALRLVVYLVTAQLFAFVTAWLLTLGLGLAGVEMFRTSLDELASARTSRLIIDSLVSDENGAVKIVPNTALREEFARAPALKFSAYDPASREILAGSSPELSPVLKDALSFAPSHTHFKLPGDPPTTTQGLAERRWTPFGRLYIAVYHQKFRWDDIVHAAGEDMQSLAVYLAMGIFLSAVSAWLAVQFGLYPLRAFSATVARIDMNSLHQRLSHGEVPAEIDPVVDAMNIALTSLEAGVTRMRRYTANAAHELRTPLAILRARLENPETPAFKTDIKRDASHLQAIVEQLLIAARLGEHQAATDRSLDLNETTWQVVADYSPLAVESGRNIDFEPSDAPVIIRGNAQAIKCVVANLLDNALRTELVGGVVCVRVSSDATIEVIDHGEGIAINDRRAVFEPFWRKSESTPGAGLGLAIAKELMDKLQGRIWIEETPGGGATFKLSFPTIQAG